ncbi:hypothetical protein LXL04_014129 [Taraxacum kok-saghyz]
MIEIENLDERNRKTMNDIVHQHPYQLICEAKSLRELDLSSNNMGGTLPPCLGSSSNSLFILNLRGNSFRGEMMNVFTHGSQLLSIDLSENGFTGQLPRSLTNCTDLEVLSLGDNSFNDVFPFWLGTLAKLQVLVLRSNKLYGPIQDSKNVSSHFSKLRIIDLSNNRFNGRLHERYFENWNAMKSAYNGESSVLESWMFLNSFSSQRPYSMTLIYKGVRTQFEQILDIFTAIDLSSNNFEGDITISLQDLRGLESLNLSNNHFTGSVFPSLGYLKNLESLDLSRNKLSGEIPQQLVQLGFLAIFNVSFNNLDGRIPLGKQFNTFDKSSYEGNPRLCGEPLSNECQNQNQNAPRPSRPEPTSDESDSLFPSEGLDWVFVFSGVGSGLIIGMLSGTFCIQDTLIISQRGRTYGSGDLVTTDKRSNQV